MNGLRRICTVFPAAVLLALAAVVGPAFAHDGDDHSGSGSNSGKAEEHSGPDEHSGDHASPDRQKPEEPGDKGDGSDELPETETPERGKHLNASVEHGIILVRMPGTHRTVVLHNAASLPVGAVVDARHGAVTFVTVPNEQGEPQQATFSGSVFQVNQKAKGRYTDLTLRGGSFASCSRPPRPAARRSAFGRSFLPLASMTRKRRSGKRSVRKLWGSGHGHFRTRGRNGAATVRGTVWLTSDRCDGTLVRVKRGLVDVRDFARHRNVSVPAGHSYLARAKKAKKHGHAHSARKRQKPRKRRR
jgi:hypothetical protein